MKYLDLDLVITVFVLSTKHSPASIIQNSVEMTTFGGAGPSLVSFLSKAKWSGEGGSAQTKMFRLKL